MGSAVNNGQIIQIKSSREIPDYDTQTPQADNGSLSLPQNSGFFDKDYDVQIIQICNTALAIKNKQHTINVELSLKCQGLPTMKAFSSTDSMVVVLKSDQSAVRGVRNFVEIGRTQVVCNQVNPKYMRTFVFPFKRQTSQQLQFRIYQMLNTKTKDIHQQKLIGKVNTNLYSLVESVKDQQQIKQVSKTSSKAILKLHCSQYQGSNSYYQIMMQLSNFQYRYEIYFVIEAIKNGQSIPIVKSEARKCGKFKQIKISCDKFKGQDNCGIQIRVYTLDKQEQLGCTKQIPIFDTAGQKGQPYRCLHNGFFIGAITIHKWKKVTRDSFMSYIVGGARLHLLLAIDFTNSNYIEKGASLHELDENGENVYINAIRQIVGVLQYFSIQNQVALYGFGAKLPPFYKSVSQCFALNGDYFHPNVQGGVQQIIRLYKQNLQKIKMHGPTKISQVLQLAIKYASQQQIMSTKSSTYYVLLIVTDGKINDYQDTVDLIVKAANLPLSLLFVGVGNGYEGSDKKPFSALQSLDEQTLKLKHSKTGQYCKRDIVDLIKMSDFQKDYTRQLLARQTFAQIPNHFIDYMIAKNIKPMKEKKSLKAAKAEFIAEKIKANTQKFQTFVSSFLQKQRKQMNKKLQSLGLKDSITQKMQIAMNDLSYFIQVYSQNKNNKHQKSTQRIEYINVRQVKKLQQYLDKKDQNKKIKTLQKLEKIQSNQYGRRVKVAKKIQQQTIQQKKYIQNPCLKCMSHQINMAHMQCGHCSQCFECFTERCPICYHINKKYKKFEFDQNGDLQAQQSADSQDSDE